MYTNSTAEISAIETLKLQCNDKTVADSLKDVQSISAVVSSLVGYMIATEKASSEEAKLLNRFNEQATAFLAQVPLLSLSLLVILDAWEWQHNRIAELEARLAVANGESPSAQEIVAQIRG